MRLRTSPAKLLSPSTSGTAASIHRDIHTTDINRHARPPRCCCYPGVSQLVYRSFASPETRWTSIHCPSRRE
ncbi:hypothetical protein BCV70DRAFT_199382 [Testicularia cyperi]|uniref:Uncharacterized protein n=1 Tax=Testicularia cyperi TaxID=1882483 RepID=A0A317XTB2_9BASI|nr:hypothetical protein BCV70DRAFT_199382 [Testicularia cyperi]